MEGRFIAPIPIGSESLSASVVKVYINQQTIVWWLIPWLLKIW